MLCRRPSNHHSAAQVALMLLENLHHTVPVLSAAAGRPRPSVRAAA